MKIYLERLILVKRKGNYFIRSEAQARIASEKMFIAFVLANNQILEGINYAAALRKRKQTDN